MFYLSLQGTDKLLNLDSTHGLGRHRCGETSNLHNIGLYLKVILPLYLMTFNVWKIVLI